MSKKPLILGIESSCDETAASVITENEQGIPVVLSNIVSSQVEVHKEFGQGFLSSSECVQGIGYYVLIIRRYFVFLHSLIQKSNVKKAKLLINNQEFDFPLVLGSENEISIDVKQLRALTGGLKPGSLKKIQ